MTLVEKAFGVACAAGLALYLLAELHRRDQEARAACRDRGGEEHQWTTWDLVCLPDGNGGTTCHTEERHHWECQFRLLVPYLPAERPLELELELDGQVAELR